jgi:hypothetical protein
MTLADVGAGVEVYYFIRLLVSRFGWLLVGCLFGRLVVELLVGCLFVCLFVGWFAYLLVGKCLNGLDFKWTDVREVDFLTSAPVLMDRIEFLLLVNV